MWVGLTNFNYDKRRSNTRTKKWQNINRFFSDDEAIRQPRPEIGEYEFEDGVKTSATMFWHFRQQDYWNDGWEEKK